MRKDKNKDKVNKQMSWEQEQEERKKRRRSRMIKIGLLVGIIIFILLLLRSCDKGVIEQLPDPVREVINIGKEDTIDGDIKVDKEQIQAKLNQQAMDESLIGAINRVPVFMDYKLEGYAPGTIKGNLIMLNDDENNFDFFVELKLEGTKEIIYQSKVIDIGTHKYYVDADEFKIPLDKGVYECDVIYNAVHPEGGFLVGQSGTKVTITVIK